LLPQTIWPVIIGNLYFKNIGGVLVVFVFTPGCPGVSRVSDCLHGPYRLSSTGVQFSLTSHTRNPNRTTHTNDVGREFTPMMGMLSDVDVR
jgi:hypothetical protein